METAVLGAYEDDSYDQHSHLQRAFDGGLGESISFGRFTMDSFSWVKRSSFNHNQYLEELGNCSASGSVRQKKAYFEAYYKAKREALEKALLEESNAAAGDNGVADDPETQEGQLVSDIVNAMANKTLPFQNLEYTQTVNDRRNVMDAEEAKVFLEDQPTSKILEEIKYDCVIQSEAKNVGGVKEEETVDSASCDVVPQSGHADDGHAGTHAIERHVEEIVDVYSMKKTSISQVKKPPKVPGPSHPHRSKSKLTSATLNDASNTVPKNRKQGSESAIELKSHASTRQGSESVIEIKNNAGTRQGFEMKNHAGTSNTHSHSTVTVPQPFALATNKRAALSSTPSDQEGYKKFSKPVCSGSSRLLTSKKTEDYMKKASSAKSETVENRKNPNERNQSVTKSKELSIADKERNVTVLMPRTKSCIKSRVTTARNSNNTFNFKSDQRAEKRKEFNSKIEAKYFAKEAEKCQAEAKTQEEAEQQIKQLRKTLNFKATPMPNFYQESQQPKLDAKKVPTTRAKSPKLGRRNILNSNVEITPPTASSKQDEGVANHYTKVEDDKEESFKGMSPSCSDQCIECHSLCAQPTTTESELVATDINDNIKQVMNHSDETLSKLAISSEVLSETNHMPDDNCIAGETNASSDELKDGQVMRTDEMPNRDRKKIGVSPARTVPSPSSDLPPRKSSPGKRSARMSPSPRGGMNARISSSPRKGTGVGSEPSAIRDSIRIRGSPTNSHSANNFSVKQSMKDSDGL